MVDIMEGYKLAANGSYGKVEKNLVFFMIQNTHDYYH